MRNALTRLFATSYGLDAKDLALLLGIPVTEAAARLDSATEEDLSIIPRLAHHVEVRVSSIAAAIVQGARESNALARSQGVERRFMIHVFLCNQDLLDAVRAGLNPYAAPEECIASLHRIAVWRAIGILRRDGIVLGAVMFDPDNPAPLEKRAALLEKDMMAKTLH